MRILYVYPHPDDESFGPALAMAKQRRQGREVFLLTLTKGGATKQRHKFGYSVEEMGEIRWGEMQDVARVLDLSGMTVLDHLITHAAVKRVYLGLKPTADYLKRLAFLTITEEQAARRTLFRLNGSKTEEIDCLFPTEEIDIETAQKSLDCYVTFQETIEKSGIREFIGREVYYEIFQERHDPPLADIFEGLV